MHSLNLRAESSLLSVNIEFDSRYIDCIVSGLMLGELKGLSPSCYFLSNFGMRSFKKYVIENITILTPTLLCNSLSHLC